jgi:hypothetical protein
MHYLWEGVRFIFFHPAHCAIVFFLQAKCTPSLDQGCPLVHARRMLMLAGVLPASCHSHLQLSAHFAVIFCAAHAQVHLFFSRNFLLAVGCAATDFVGCPVCRLSARTRPAVQSRAAFLEHTPWNVGRAAGLCSVCFSPLRARARGLHHNVRLPSLA